MQKHWGRVLTARKGLDARRTLAFAAITLSLIAAGIGARADDTSALLSSGDASIWKDGVGEGFRAGTQDVGFLAGGTLGLPIFGSKHTHYFGLAFGRLGWILTDVVGAGRWYKGNWEFQINGFGGSQFAPTSRYVAGAGPLLVYDFAAGYRLVPFVEAGAGGTATDVRDGDLSTSFEFNLQLGAGLHFFLKPNVALTVESRFIHFSNAGMKDPNQGVNDSAGLLGLTWFF
ncbi:MAG TPA: acyloxyacyl hydrolase [Verrucomicrobiae bacterium]|nr:acyloxyacyl hydrolase [Verrucomicrobiae bacterium]